jgi:hypothetical protein
MNLSLRQIARALGGEISGGEVRAPGPGHLPKDRSLCVRLSPNAADGFVVHSHAGDDWESCRDYVRERAGLPFTKERGVPAHAPAPERPRSNGLSLWQEARDLRGTLAQKYLEGRSLLCGEDLSHAIRFHPACPFKQERFPALLSLIRNIHSDEPQGLQRTALLPSGEAVKRDGKTFRMTLGAMKAGAVKIDPDKDVTQGLCIGAGLESTLTGRQMGYAPAWALLSDDGIANFPALPGLEGLTIFLENDERNQNQHASYECGLTWWAAGRAVFTVRPIIGNDLNDEIREAR